MPDCIVTPSDGAGKKNLETCGRQILKHVGDKTPVLTCFYVREEEDKVVGMINIRLALNSFLAGSRVLQRNLPADHSEDKSLRARDCGQVLASKRLLAPHSSKSYNNHRNEPLLSAVFLYRCERKNTDIRGRKGKG